MPPLSLLTCAGQSSVWEPVHRVKGHLEKGLVPPFYFIILGISGQVLLVLIARPVVLSIVRQDECANLTQDLGIELSAQALA